MFQRSFGINLMQGMKGTHGIWRVAMFENASTHVIFSQSCYASTLMLQHLTGFLHYPLLTHRTLKIFPLFSYFLLTMYTSKTIYEYTKAHYRLHNFSGNAPKQNKLRAYKSEFTVYIILATIHTSEKSYEYTKATSQFTYFS